MRPTTTNKEVRRLLLGRHDVWKGKRNEESKNLGNVSGGECSKEGCKRYYDGVRSPENPRGRSGTQRRATYKGGLESQRVGLIRKKVETSKK